METIHKTKAKIRNRIKSLLKQTKEEELTQKSRAVKKALFKSEFFKKAKTVMFYMSVGGEVDTSEMIRDAQKLGKKVVVPVCCGKRALKPCLLREDGALLMGPDGIFEPALKTPVNLKDLGLVVVPGIAFDRNGKRLGKGKGYYDCFLKKLPKTVRSVGLAYDFQVLRSVPTTPRDIDVHTVIFA